MTKINTEIDEYPLFISGKMQFSSDGKFFERLNPANGEPIGRIADASLHDMETAIQSARTAFDGGAWSQLSLKERGQFLREIAELIREHAKELANIESLDTGKTLKQTTFIDVPTCADTFEYFSTIEKFFDPRQNAVNAPVKSLTQREPRGVVGAIIPWNYPLIMAAWKIAPCLMTGNTIVLKPSRQGSLSILRLAHLIAEQMTLPVGVLNIVTTTREETSTALVKSPLVHMISFTGGTSTGQKIMELGAKTAKKVSLELGGKSPNIVFADADYEAALGGTMSAIFMNQGQMCTAGSRLFLEDKIYDKFLNDLILKTKSLKIGDPLSYETDFGPLVSREHRDHVLDFIEAGKNGGAKIVCGGGIPAGQDLQNGAYLEPTIFVDVKADMTIAQEEAFGPVLTVFKFSTEEQVLQMANDSKYGLAACIWTKDLEKANRVAKKLQAGTVWINTYGGFYNEASFGGYKQSGFGRELGVEGLLEYTQTKHVCIDQTPGGKSLACSWF